LVEEPILFYIYNQMETQYGYHLAIPNRQKKRTLGYLKQKWIEFKEHPSIEGFFDVTFPGLDEEGFRGIVNQLKQQGVTIIGADEQLTERKIMKLTDLLKEAQTPGTPDVTSQPDLDGNRILNQLEDIIIKWRDSSQYENDADRWLAYSDDIEGLVDFYRFEGDNHDEEENGKKKDGKRDEEDMGRYSKKNPMAEQKLAKSIKKEVHKLIIEAKKIKK
jgi:hypothetical protein